MSDYDERKLNYHNCLLNNFLKCNKNNVIFYIHPKAGSVNITKRIFNHLGILEIAEKYNKWIHAYRFNIFIKDNSVTLDLLKNNKYKKIKFVRNPYDRAVSIFIGIFRTVVESYEYNNHLYIDKLNHQIQDLIKSNKYNFITFLTLIDKLYESIYDAHIREQWSELDSIIKYDEIIKIENIDQKLDYLREKYNINLAIQKKDTYSYHHNKTNSNNTSLYTTIVLNHNNLDDIPSYRYFYNDTTRGLVEKIYKNDILNYGYKFYY